MAGTHNSDPDEPIAEINVVPLVDIILVVLIIFMVTAPLVLKPTIDVSLPQASSGEQSQKPQTLEVLIDKTGEFYLNGKKVSLDELKEQAAAEAALSGESSAVLTADKGVTLETLTEIIDTIKTAGIRKVGFSIQKRAQSKP